MAAAGWVLRLTTAARPPLTGSTADRLYRRLPEEELYRTDAYGAYGLLPADRHIAGKGGAVNRTEGFHS